MNIDSKAMQIIEELRKAARVSIRDIANNIGMKHPTVHKRVQKLIKNKTIKHFTIRVDKDSIGEGFVVLVLLNRGKLEFVDKEIKEIHTVSGEYDTLLKLRFKDVDEYNNFIKKFKEKHQLKKIKTIIATKTEKEII